MFCITEQKIILSIFFLDIFFYEMYKRDCRKTEVRKQKDFQLYSFFLLTICNLYMDYINIQNAGRLQNAGPLLKLYVFLMPARRLVSDSL